MKKRWLALLCALSLAVTGLFCRWNTAQAVSYEGVYLVGVNDTVMLSFINRDNMPFNRNGVIYVPYTVLNNRELGLSYVLNKTDGTFTVYTRQKSIIFPTTGGGAKDKEGNEYNDGIVTRNAKIYLPVRFLASCFGLTYSYLNLTMSDGTVPMVRLRSDSAQLDDERFAASAVQLVQPSLSQYMASLAPPSAAATQTVRPATPTPTPSAAPSREPLKPVTVYLAVACTDGTGFDQILNTLASYGRSVLFLFEPDQLISRDEDVRKAAAAGHQIGLLLPGEGAEEAYAAGNALLGHIFRGEATQVAFREGGPQEGNWQVWSETVTLRGRTPAARAADLLADLQASRTGVACVTLPDSLSGAQTLADVMGDLTKEPYTLRVATETTMG